ncbi:MAG TPA: hypothetical protein VFU71_09135 [Burkholderiaceae bacterium]|nr:hypothetical protein [Burkholderiaceae bacterium]
MTTATNPFGPGADSYNRLGVVLQNRAHITRSEWFAQLGDAWSVCDHITRCRSDLRTIPKSATRADLHLMMTAEERQTLATMPEGSAQASRVIAAGSPIACARSIRPRAGWSKGF